MSEARGQSPSGLRILHVIASMGAEVGGPPAVCAGLTRSLAARGHRVTVATLEWPGSTPVPVASGVELKTFKLVPGSERYAKSPEIAAWLDGHVRDFDIVHLHSIWQFPTFAAARACWKSGVPYVDLLNGMLDRYSVGQRSGMLKRIYWMWREGKVAKRSKGIHFLNRAEIRCAVPWLAGVPKFVIGNGIGEAELARLPAKGKFRAAYPWIGDRPLVLFLSRIHPKKGLERLIPAWKRFVEKMPEAVFAIAGTGDAAELTTIDKLIAENGLTEKVKRVGQLIGEKKWEALVDADVFVLPSYQEGFSMAITEAMAAGCPPVITQECNFDEVEEEKCGVVIRNGDMGAFLDAVVDVLKSPEKRAAYSLAGAKFVRERYTWERIAEDMEKVYRAILAGKKLAADGDDVWR